MPWQFWLIIAFFALAALLVAVAFLRMFHGVQGAQFDPLPDDVGRYRFRSDFGLFEVDRERTRLRLVGPSNSRVVPLERIVGVDVRTTEVPLGRWEEFLMGGWELSDLSGKYRDRTVWQVVVLVLDDGGEIPVFSAGQLHKREFLQQALTDLSLYAMQSIGIVEDAGKLARDVRDELRVRLVPKR